MNINKILNSLGKSWERDDILLKIKNGLDADKIVNEFIANNEIQIKKLNALLKKRLLPIKEQLSSISLLHLKVWFLR